MDSIWGVGRRQFAMSGGLGAKKELDPNQKIRNIRAEGKKGVNMCVGNFLKKDKFTFNLTPCAVEEVERQES